MLIKLDRSFFMYLTLMLSISFNVFAKDESSGDEIVPADDCAPCERLDLIDAILGVNTWEKVSNYSDKQSDFYKDVVLNSIPGEEGNDPDAVAKMKEFIKGNTIIGTLESGIETNKTDISGNKTSITDNKNAIDANRIVITNNTNAINANRTVIENHEDRIQQLESRKLNLDKQINQLHRDIKSLDDRLASGIAASNAMAGLVSATKDGKSMIAVGLGTYRDRSAIAIGISRLSDNGRWKAKFSFATGMNGSNKDLSTSTSIGYQF
ncbi:YadA family autotransporter adhesin [Gallibacterium salpingitidis]|uniref:Trimeric autotransporter adhesin YadA-like C-terminal membrane anchor domain-containing protein n=1 Tax=Gallibacterium salpingitidis TaxID=505341 RepID=A0A1A7NS79_9PAST|nr:YadA C-terminal domain-containing protein [Gallibacterium salpingitidis]OBW92498.1 hypothetical protein QS62_08905 [Gallibacterium salpingitidis]